MIIRINPNEADKFYPCLTTEVMERIQQEKEIAIGSVDSGGKPQGVMTLSMVDAIENHQGQNYLMEYFYVLPKYRRQGVFREMLSFLKEDSDGIEGVIAQVIVPDMESDEAVFGALGFEQLEDGNDIITLPLSSMKDSNLTFPNIVAKQDELVPLDELLSGQRELFLKKFGDDLPAGLRPENMPGQLLMDHSFVYLTNTGNYGGFLLASALSDGTLYLGSMFVKPEYSHMALVFLSALFSAATAPGNKYRFKRIMYATASADAVRLSNHVLEWCEAEASIKHTHNYYLTLS